MVRTDTDTDTDTDAEPRFADGVTVGFDVVRAVERAAAQARTALEGRRPDLAFVFVGSADEEAVAAALGRASEATGAAVTLGCTASDGVIGGRHGIQGISAASVWLASLPGVSLRSFHLEVMRTSETIAVVGLPPQQDGDGVGLLLADAWSFPIEGFVDQSRLSLPGLPLAGGVAAGRGGAGTTRLLVDDRVVDRGAVGVLVGGEVAVRAVVSQGCRPVGPAMVVTAAEDNVVFELAGRPALDRLDEVVRSLGPVDHALASRGMQLGVAVDEYAEEPEQGDFLVRGIVGVDTDRRALAIGDVVEVGRTVRFQLRDSGAAEADLVTTLGDVLLGGVPSPVSGALLFCCNGRGSALFDSADHDVLAVRQAFADSPVAGFFAAGEIGPVGGVNHLHGYSASVVAFGSASPRSS